jgi:hypothetical protein
MTHLTTLEELNQQITVLASVEESDALFISVYLNLEDETTDWRETLNDRARLLRLILKGDDLADLNDALDKVETWLSTELLPEAKSAAIFVRGIFGGAFMLPMQFAAPLPNWIAVYPTPNIYHLVELKDNYHRYIVLFAMPDRASIVEVNLGAATTRAWINNPDLSRRVGQEWSRPHFQVHMKHRGNRFMQEKIEVLERLMHAGGHTHLILTGDPKITQSIRLALPEGLADKLVDIIPASKRDQQTDIVMATLSCFIEHEEQESQSIVENLIEGLHSHNLAVAGTADTLAVLRWGEVDTLVMTSDYQPDPGWTCTTCRAINIELLETSTCPQCGALTARPIDIREAMLRLAGQLECAVEVVEHSDALMSLGGVGCLLRTHFDKNMDMQVNASDVSN